MLSAKLKNSIKRVLMWHCLELTSCCQMNGAAPRTAKYIAVFFYLFDFYYCCFLL